MRGVANPSYLHFGGGAVYGVGEVLALFRHLGPMTRAEVMARTGLARSTVNQRIDTLVMTGLLTQSGEGEKARGRPAERFTFNADNGVLLVADIGATGLRAALCDLEGTMVDEREEDIAVQVGPVPILELIERLFDELLAARKKAPADVRGIGISVPGPVDFSSGRVVSPPIMTGWDRYEIPAWFRPKYDCEVLVDKDVNAMAFGEQRTRYPELPHLLWLKVGTGVGCGIVVSGQVHRGADGAAGDIGHVHMHVDDVDEEPVCRCGNSGCVEAYAGGWAMIRDLQAVGRDVQTVDDVVRLVRGGDLVAVRLARRAGRILGEAIAEMVSLLNPRVIVVGGQLAHTDEQLFAGIRELVYRRSLPLATRKLQIVRSELDPRAGVIGLALVVADRVFSPERVEAFVAG